MVPEYCDIEGLSGNFRLITDENALRKIKQTQDVNNHQLSSRKHTLEEAGGALESQEMSEKETKLTKEQDEGIFECVQRQGESNTDWIIRHMRGARAYRKKMDAANTTPEKPSQSKTTGLTSNGDQPKPPNQRRRTRYRAGGHGQAETRATHHPTFIAEKGVAS